MTAADPLVQRLRAAAALPTGLYAEAAARIESDAAKIAALVEQHHRDSAELRALCEARDEVRRERDRLTA